MSAPADGPPALLERGDPDPGLALGRGLPNVPWTILQRDRIYNLLLAGGQGSGKSSLLLRMALNDILAANTATVVLDMKGTLSERLLRLTPPDVEKRWWDEETGRWQEGTKRLWYLDLGRPAFGLTPLRVEAPWSHAGLADEFARIADAVCRALLDLYPGQILGSSEDLIERAVVGTMAIAWFEHERRCKREGVEPTTRGFSGSFEVLSQMFAPSDRFTQEEAGNTRRRRTRPNRWHQAAGRACQRLPNLDQVADTLLYEIPRQARDNLADIAKRMEAPANKIRPLVGAAASVRRFVGHPERLSLRSVIEAHDTLIVNPRVELIGEDQAAILTDFIVHMLDLQLKRQVAVPRPRRPRVSLIIDEAHRLITATLISMIATHREAGLNVAAAVQYVSQLGADEPSAARREKILKGVGNLLQSKVLFRMSDSEDADRHTQIFRSVYETMVRADPTSRARMPFDPARMQTLRDHHGLVSLVSTADAANGGGLVAGGPGATRLPAFVTQTYAMPEVEEIPDRWREQHLARQREVFRRYPEDMSSLAVRDVPAGLDGEARHAEETVGGQADARRVAEETVGRRPDGALGDAPPQARDAAISDAERDDGRQERTPGEGYDLTLFESGGDEDTQEKPGTREYDERLFEPGGPKAPAPGDGPSQDEPTPGWERVGGVRIERAEQPAREGDGLVAASPVLRLACRPTRQPLPERDLPPATEGARSAVREAATFEAITGLPDWETAGEEARGRASRAASAAREQALAEGEAAGLEDQERRRNAERRARRAAAEVLTGYGDAPWRAPLKDLELGEGDVHTLELIARLRFASPSVLTELLAEPARERAVRSRLTRLHDAGLVARSEVAIEGRRGRRPRLYAAAPRGLEYLRLRHSDLRPDQEPAVYLRAERKLPSAGKGREVPHELAVQLTVVALRQYDTRVHWHTTRMPGGRWDVGMVHEDRRDRSLRLADLTPAPGLTVHGEQLDAPPTLEPDLSVQLQGQAGTQRAVIDLLVELDRTGRGAYNATKFSAYDHFLGGWCLRTRHWGKERRTRPIVVFVAHSPQAMLALLHGADQAMGLGFGGRGRYEPAQFEFPGRAHTAFTCLDWLLAGRALALRLPALPPQVRGQHTELRPEHVALLPAEWWPAAARN
jgi:Replication-relaxation/Type IV secretion-system coupling protein DNA-binding domain